MHFKCVSICFPVSKYIGLLDWKYPIVCGAKFMVIICEKQDIYVKGITFESYKVFLVYTTVCCGLTIFNCSALQSKQLVPVGRIPKSTVIPYK